MLTSSPAWTTNADNAVILLYHHVSTTTPASTSVSPSVFEEHLQYLAEGYNVISLEQAVTALKAKQLLPERAVVITFDDGYRNIYDNAHPRLRKYGMPYTVFINPQMIGKQMSQLNWQQVAEMKSDGAQFANHTSQHRHLLERAAGESLAEWLDGIEKDIAHANALLDRKLASNPAYVAYPYGEFNTDIQSLVATLGMVGFGQHSGGIYSGSDFTALPRFPASGLYGNLRTLKTKINSLAMPVNSSSVLDPVAQQNSVGDFSFTVAGGDVIAQQMGCFYANEALPVSVDGYTVTVTLEKTLPIGRSRVNCTAPSQSQPGRYYWYSQPWFVADQNGKYPD
ncbi:polysaccharide deacetylase [Luminiphilus syltensis NOR5-1B]|uniref:Polysaccharide deacetylase n=2 Tax=Luminiphilus TaxID=1341118 RepID=B8KVK1_9GAMM|nr:polysaccharide deacetylase [Luminiphilus syltensis NOR5-1B]